MQQVAINFNPTLLTHQSTAHDILGRVFVIVIITGLNDLSKRHFVFYRRGIRWSNNNFFTTPTELLCIMFFFLKVYSPLIPSLRSELFRFCFTMTGFFYCLPTIEKGSASKTSDIPITNFRIPSILLVIVIIFRFSQL